MSDLGGVKPGHWVTASQEVTANKSNYQAIFHGETWIVDNEPIQIADSDYHLRYSRPVNLTKGEPKNIKSLYFVPRDLETDKKSILLNGTLRSKAGGREVGSGSQPVPLMPSYQYYFVVVTDEPSSYTVLKTLPSIRLPRDEVFDESVIDHYQVTLMNPTEGLSLPEHSLTWTQTAYVLWDGIIPDDLNAEQQQALLDWLHWGGQLIISGPDSLEALRGSFLDEHLPALSDAAISLNQSDLQELSDAWSIASQKTGDANTISLPDGKTLRGLKLSTTKSGTFIPKTGELVAEGAVGRGRILITSFALNDPAIKFWKSFDNFFNAVLLRRPAREYYAGEVFSEPHLRWKETEYPQMDASAMLTTKLRYFSRDLAQEKTSEWEAGFRSWSGAGVGGWNDFSGAAIAARAELQSAAGITIPKASFVFQAVACYLLVLVPLNWCFFKLIGRIEWAWVMAPVIALLGTFGVIWYAQLDIGFARSETELAILETHSGYHRGHLTRYTAMYTSLSSPYQFEFEHPSAVALPFSLEQKENNSFLQSLSPIYLNQADTLNLSGMNVSSNSTDMLHSEQMYSLGGSFSLKQSNHSSEYQLSNETNLTLQDVAVVRKEAGKYQTAWVGNLNEKESLNLRFSRFSDEISVPQWKDSAVTSTEQSGDIDGELRLGRLFQVATSTLQLNEGEYRMIGWTDQLLAGMKTRPHDGQKQQKTIVINHLKLTLPPLSSGDVNVIADVIEEDNETEILPEDISEN